MVHPKKYGTHSALNMFDEFSMIEAGPMVTYMGFTEDEVDLLCQQWGRGLDECHAWYDGYLLEDVGSVYAPKESGRNVPGTVLPPLRVLDFLEVATKAIAAL